MFLERLPIVKAFPLSDSIIINDLMKEAYGREVHLFTKGFHHRNLSVIHLKKIFFHQGNGTCDISSNAQHVVYFKNPRDLASGES
ncbi:hypothetical protein J437_LFUL018031 [Ladona fulva]|uniref:Uncharacterized protein n=1 Tax=Ladona fulva TaxID=123851 RepID=A0A8K0PC75_LADFU|nr:hypothetical protein J437_LFUL018031 [Ladona fulva]